MAAPRIGKVTGYITREGERCWALVTGVHGYEDERTPMLDLVYVNGDGEVIEVKQVPHESSTDNAEVQGSDKAARDQARANLRRNVWQ